MKNKILMKRQFALLLAFVVLFGAFGAWQIGAIEGNASPNSGIVPANGNYLYFDIYVSTEGELRQALGNIYGTLPSTYDGINIILTDDIELTTDSESAIMITGSTTHRVKFSGQYSITKTNLISSWTVILHICSAFPVTLNGPTLDGQGRSGVVYVHDNSTFIMNAGTIKNAGSSYLGWGAYTGGAGVEVEGATFIMNGGYIIDNYSTGARALTGAGLGGFGGGIIATSTDQYPSNIFINGGIISGNTSDNGAGIAAIRLGYQSVNLYINGGEISGNTASVSGGGVMSVGSYVEFYDGLVTGNTAVENGGGFYFMDTSAIGFPFPVGTLNVIRGSITNNHAGYDGGGIYYGGHVATARTPYYHFYATDFPGLNIGEYAVFSGNRAGNGVFIPHETADLLTNIASENTSATTHLLNNWDINARGDAYDYIPAPDGVEVTITKRLLTPVGTVIPTNVHFAFFADFVSWNGILPTNANWPAVLDAPEITTATDPILIPIATGAGTTANGITTRYMVSGNILADMNWTATGRYVFRVWEHDCFYWGDGYITPGSGWSSPTFSQMQFYLNVYVAYDAPSGEFYVRYVTREVAVICGNYLAQGQAAHPAVGVKVTEMIFQNTYTLNYHSENGAMVVTKTVDGDIIGDRTRLFNFAITLQLDHVFFYPGSSGTGYVWCYYCCDDYMFMGFPDMWFYGFIFDANGDPVLPPVQYRREGQYYYLWFFNGDTINIQLAHGWSFVINAPVGTRFIVTETPVEGYTPSWSINGGTVTNSATTGPGWHYILMPTYIGDPIEPTNPSTGSRVDFVNYHIWHTPTGLTLANGSVIALVVLTLGALAGFIVVKAKKVRGLHNA
ncbi:MAG: hypothetical protein FWB93_03660 [Oscillospiraceae bacterium]|nr:hypothetical protein [Oscillospiraceae bacterium]